MPPTPTRLAALGLCMLVTLVSCGGGDDADSDSAGFLIETIAGGFNIGDGRPATATFVHPVGVAVDPNGGLLISDYNPAFGRTILRRVDARTGTIATVGGPCDQYAVSGEPASACDLDTFALVVGDTPDELFVATGDWRVFRVDGATGALEHLAGRGGLCNNTGGASPREMCLGYVHDIARDAAGNLYLSQPDTGEVRRLDATYEHLEVVAGEKTFYPCIDPSDAVGPVPALQACIRPRAIAIDRHGKLLIASYEDGRIDRVEVESGLLTTIAGTPGACTGARGDGGPAALACLVKPSALAVAPDGSLFIAEENRIRRIDAETGTITTVVEHDAVARDVAVAPGGDLVFTEPGHVSRLDPASGATRTVAGNDRVSLCGDGEPVQHACLGRAAGLAPPAPDGDVYFADSDNGRIGRIDAATGHVTTVADSRTVSSCGDVGSRADFCLGNPHDVVRDRDGNLYVADRGTDQEEYDVYFIGRVRRIDAVTGDVTTIAGNCTNAGGTDAADTCLYQPRTLILDGHGGLVVGANNGVQRIDLVRGTTRYLVGGSRTPVENCTAAGIPAIDACIAADDLALDAAGDLYVLDAENSRIWRVDTTTGILTTFAGSGTIESGCDEDGRRAVEACLNPKAMVIDRRRLIVATDGRLRTIDLASGRVRTIAGGPSECPYPPSENCLFPTDMELDDRGRLLVTDVFTRAIRRVTLP